MRLTPEYQHLQRILEGRRSIRRFRPDPVPAKVLEHVLEAARWAPTAGNRQAFRFVIVSAPDLIEEMGRAVEEASRALIERVNTQASPEAAALTRAYTPHFCHFRRAPCVIVPIYRIDEALPWSNHDPLDVLSSVSAAITNMLLAAHALGLGACWMTGPLVAEPSLSQLLDVPQGWHIAAVVPIGIPDETPAPPSRKQLARLCLRRPVDAVPCSSLPTPTGPPTGRKDKT